MNSNISLKRARAYLDALDLTYIANSMCRLDYPLPQWELSQALQCLQLYKNFLYLQKKYANDNLVPSREIDEFWHNHILHTQKYMYDCQQIFGHYLHHEPASPHEDNQPLIDNYLKTKQLYLDEFGEPLQLIKP